MKLKDDVEELVGGFERVTKKPEAFVSNEEDLTGDIRVLIKSYYDFVKAEEATRASRTSSLPKLIVDDFDSEQIWQQLELQNEEILTRSLANASRLLIGKDRLLFTELDKADEKTEVDIDGAMNETDPSDDDSSLKQEEEDEDEEEEEDEDEEEEEKEKEEVRFTKSPKKSVVDDDFFKLSEMESFLKAEEQKMNDDGKQDKSTDGSDDDDDQEENIDLFEAGSTDGDDDDIDDEENNRQRNPRYDDFFGDAIDNRKPNRLSEMEEEEEEDAEGDGDEEKQEKAPDLKSTLELREERLKTRIEDIEQMALSDKPWQLKGEITADNRPQNSLLEEIVEFDLTSRPAPVMTEQTTFQLEDIIRQRIKDRTFDSVERKQKPVETPLEYKKKLVLNQEKSKESLAQIYEREYLQQQEALDPNAADKEEEDPETHREIKSALHSLFAKLDALSNFHFTPKMAAPELKIVNNLPAINIEEVAPVATSDAALLAPEEVKPKAKGDEIGKTERTATDKKRERRKKKLKQKRRAGEKKKTEKMMDKLRPGLGNKHSKEKAKKMLEKASKNGNVDKMTEDFGRVKSSTAFFKQLEEDVKSQIKSKSLQRRNEKKHDLKAKKMKL